MFVHFSTVTIIESNALVIILDLTTVPILPSAGVLGGAVPRGADGARLLRLHVVAAGPQEEQGPLHRQQPARAHSRSVHLSLVGVKTLKKIEVVL